MMQRLDHVTLQRDEVKAVCLFNNTLWSVHFGVVELIVNAEE